MHILWFKALHLIFMVTWFSGLFYLPRLFVYHAMASDETSLARFKIMERKLFFGIMTPGAILTLIFGALTLSAHGAWYLNSPWMQLKLLCVFFLLLYHLYLGILIFSFKKNANRHSHVFYRWLNEMPVLFLVAIILLATLKPF